MNHAVARQPPGHRVAERGLGCLPGAKLIGVAHRSRGRLVGQADSFFSELRRYKNPSKRKAGASSNHTRICVIGAPLLPGIIDDLGSGRSRPSSTPGSGQKRPYFFVFLDIPASATGRKQTLVQARITPDMRT